MGLVLIDVSQCLLYRGWDRVRTRELRERREQDFCLTEATGSAIERRGVDDVLLQPE